MFQKGEYSEKVLEEKKEEAKKELLKYKADEGFSEMENLLKIIVVFCNDKLVYEEII